MNLLKRLQAETANLKMLKLGKQKAEMKTAVLRPSPGYGGTGDRVWTLSPPARSGCALLLGRVDSFTPAHSALWAFVPRWRTNSFQRCPNASSLFAHSRCAQIKGEL